MSHRNTNTIKSTMQHRMKIVRKLSIFTEMQIQVMCQQQMHFPWLCPTNDTKAMFQPNIFHQHANTNGLYAIHWPKTIKRLDGKIHIK